MQRVYKDLIRNFPKEGENIEDKKVDDKPMVIHTKEKAKIHSHEPKGARIKGSNIYTVERGSKIAGAKAAETTGKKSYRKSTAYQANVKEKGLSRFKRIVREANALIMFKECLKYNVVPFIVEDNLKMFYYRGLKEWNNEKGYLTDTCLTVQDKYKAYLDYFRIAY